MGAIWPRAFCGEMPPFAGSSQSHWLPLPDQKLVPDAQMRPQYNVLALAELEDSPFVLTGDGKGCVSAWSFSLGKSLEEPDHYFEAHSGSISAIIPLRSGTLAEVLEDREWPLEGVDNGAQIAKTAKRRVSGNGVSKALAKIGSDDEQPPEATAAPKKSLLARIAGSVLRCFSREQKPDTQKQIKAAPRGREHSRHWLIATAAEDGAVRVWRWRVSKKQIKSKYGTEFDVDFVTEWIADKELPITSCIELPDGLLACSGKDSADVYLVDLCSSTLRWVLFGHTASVTCFAVCADGRLVSGGEDGAVRLWAKRAGWSGKENDPGGHQSDSVSGASRPGPPALVWGESGQREVARAGVSSMAFFAHMQQAEKSECIALTLRISVQKAENIPKKDSMSQSDPYVACTIVEGDPSLTNSVRTVSVFGHKEAAKWEHSCSMALRRCLVNGQWTLPECSALDFEIFVDRMRGEDTLLAHCTVPIDEIFAHIASSPDSTAEPKAYKCFAPHGQGPYKDLEKAVLNLGFTRKGDNSLGIIIDAAGGLPSMGTGARFYVRATARQSVSGKSRKVPAKLRDKTKVVDNDANPYFNEILEIEVPASMRDRTIQHGSDVYLHFEVWDFDDGPTDDLCCFLSIPFADVLNYDGGDIRPFNLTLPHKKSTSSSWFKKKEKDGLRGVADMDDEPSSPSAPLTGGGGGALAFLPKLFLGFQAIVPCPVQLRCTVEQAHAMPLPASLASKVAPVVRMRFVEGNPMLPHLTAFRTSTKRRTTKPTWGERGVLPVPDWLVTEEAPKADDDEKQKSCSVLCGWEHAPARAKTDYLICVDIYDQDIISSNDLLGRATVPLGHALNAALTNQGAVCRTRPVALIGDPKAVVWLGFERGTANELVVHVERAENLPDLTGQPDPYCVVRITEVGALGEPSDAIAMRLAGKAETEPAPTGLKDPVWRHAELLELPGGQLNSIVAARPNWHLFLEVTDANSPADTREPVLAHASVPVSELLRELRAKDPEATKPMLGLQQRLHLIRSPVGAQRRTAPPPEEEDDLDDDPVTMLLEMALLPTIRRQDLRQATAGGPAQAIAGPPIAAIGAGPGDASGAATMPGTVDSAASGLPAAPLSLPTTKQPQKSQLAPPSALQGMLPCWERALEAIRASVSIPACKDGSDSTGILLMRFEAVSRWKGAGRGPRRPIIRPMKGPSPVTCVTTLVSSIVAGHEDGNIFVWDATGVSARPIHQFSAHKAPIGCMTVFPALDCIITGGGARTRAEAISDSVLSVWTCSKFELQQTVPLHGARARVVSPLEVYYEEGKGKMSKDTKPCLVVSTDTRQQRLLQLLRIEGPTA